MTTKSSKKSSKKNGWGGARPGSGRPRSKEREELLKVVEKIKSHANEVIGMRDKKTREIIKKKRIEFVLDTLFTVAINEKNVYAIKEYLDRAVGKAVQAIDMSLSRESHLEEIEKLANITKKLIKNADEKRRKSNKGKCKSNSK